MDTSGIDRMLSQLRTAAALASRKPEAATTPDSASTADFAQALKSSLDQVSRAQDDVAKLSSTLGDQNTKLQDVVIPIQKSTMALEHAAQVGNKLVQAYHDIMNMQV